MYALDADNLLYLLGVFADGDEFIPQNTFIGIYAGEYITIEEAEKREQYVFYCLWVLLFNFLKLEPSQASTTKVEGHISLILTLTLIHLRMKSHTRVCSKMR